MSIEDKPKIFQIISPGGKETHLFEKGEIPKTLFLCLAERHVAEDGVAEALASVKIFIDADLFKGQTFENEVRALIGLKPRKEL